MKCGVAISHQNDGSGCLSSSATIEDKPEFLPAHNQPLACENKRGRGQLCLYTHSTFAQPRLHGAMARRSTSSRRRTKAIPAFIHVTHKTLSSLQTRCSSARHAYGELCLIPCHEACENLARRGGTAPNPPSLYSDTGYKTPHTHANMMHRTP